jgi:glycosyltransferase involved in cell wall biosynthesis
MRYDTMRILHITETMVSGVLKYLQEVVGVESYGDMEHFIIYSPNRENTPKDLNKLFSNSVSLIEMNIKFRNGLIKNIKSLYTQIAYIRPDVIHLHSSIAGFFGRIVSLCFPKVKVFYTPHGYSFLMTNKSNINRGIYWLAEFILSQINGEIIACSKSEYRHAKKISPLRKVFLVENCMKTNHTYKEKSLFEYKQIIGVGRLERQKNPELFIEIAANLKRIDPTIKAIWIGDGSLKQECEKLNNTLQADVYFTGWLSNEKTIEFLQDSMVFLQTSNWEGLPYSVLEAFAVGLPVVASNIESHTDLIESEYFCFIAANKTQFIEYALKLLNDIKLCREISEKNRKNLEDRYVYFSRTIYFVYNSR